MPPLRNRVFPLTITTLTPLHIGTGARLAPNIDYYVDGDTTLVVDSDAVLDLVARDWQARVPPYEETLRQYEAELERDKEKLDRQRAKNVEDIERFEEAPPRDRAKRLQQEERLRSDAAKVKERAAQLRQRRASPPAPTDNALPDALIGGSTLDQLVKAELLPLAALRGPASDGGRPPVRYAMRARPEAADIYELIKDLASRPYIPGSSLKGAIRSALAWEAYGTLREPRPQPDLQPHRDRPDGRIVANNIEDNIFLGRPGPDRQRMNNTVRDVLRTLHIGDSGPAAVAPELLAVQVFRSGSVKAPIAVEAIPASTSLPATLQIERYPFENPAARQTLDFGGWAERLAPEALAATCRRRAEALIAGERAYFASFVEAADLARFYDELAERLAQLPSRAFLLPVGWGAGWRSKTLDDRLRAAGAGEAAFAEAVRRFKLKKHKSEGFRPGDSFPQTRKVTLANKRPWRPLGWLQVEIGEEARR